MDLKMQFYNKMNTRIVKYLKKNLLETGVSFCMSCYGKD